MARASFSPIGESPHPVKIEFEAEQIEVTRAGILPPFIADTSRRFIRGPVYVYVTLSDGTELPPMTREEYVAWTKHRS